MHNISKHIKSIESFRRFIYLIGIKVNRLFIRFFSRLILRIKLGNIDKELANNLLQKRIASILELSENLTDIISSSEKIRIIYEADKTLQSTYNILGSGEITINPIDWHSDFKTGYRWAPGKYYKAYKQEDPNTTYDVKIPRELSRCHHLLKVGIAYYITRDEKYASFCINQIIDWIDENPLMRSINWGCTMDVSIRAVNWIWILRFLSGSSQSNDESLRRIKHSLFEHGWFIYRNPEKREYNNHNHYLADLTGQIHLGLLFERLPEAQKWLGEGCKELFREMRMQILPTGMTYERSTCYHRLVLELLMVPILIIKRNGREVPSDIWYRLETMFNFVFFSIKPDGTTPIIGDQDNGRLLPFGCESQNDYRYILSLGSILFNRPEFKTHGGDFNIYCAILGGQNALLKYESLKVDSYDIESKAFPDSGFYIMRSNKNYLIFNASGKGRYPELSSGTHTHSDLLSFELFVNGKPFIIDPGTYLYSADSYSRMLFRSTQMHNTVTVDGNSQNELKKEILWDFERNAIPEILEWKTDNCFDIVVARHSGYQRLENPVIHKRAIMFDKISQNWNINDELSGQGKHNFEWFFHFDENLDLIMESNSSFVTSSPGSNIRMEFFGDAFIKSEIYSDYISKAYGSKIPAKVLKIQVEDHCPVSVNIIIRSI